MDNLSEEEFFRLLGEPIEALCDYFPSTPLWLIELEQAFSSQQNLSPKKQVQMNTGFLNVIKPLIDQNRDRLHKGIQKIIQTHLELPFDSNAIADILFANLPERLGWMLSRTLILELNVSRLQGILEGDTSQERFQNFIASLSQADKALTLLQEYPVLARQLNICLNNWVECSLEFLQRLCNDWQDLQTIFSPQQDIGLLVAIDDSVSDRHRGNRSVFIVQFNSGLQLVYKPKSLAVDLHFQELLTWFNQNSDRSPFKTQKILNRGIYGWVEYIEAQDCQSQAEIWRFYERQGSYLAILYALEATDFHSENLIAAGKHPILIDLEALFHQRLGANDVKQADQIAASMLSHSVLRVGLLPQRIWSDGESQGIDMSGLGAIAGQLSPQPVPQWEESGTDRMRLTSKRIEMLGAKNRPTLRGTNINVLDYAEALAIGFTKIYRLLLRHRDRLLSNGGPLALFAEDEVRVVFRPTRIYSLLLHNGFHPDVLHNALERDRLFDLLWGNIEHNPYLEKIIPAELKDLHQGDIPIFTTRPNSCDLWDSTGQRITNFFDQSGMNLVNQRLQLLSETDLNRQLWFIRASLTTLDMVANRKQQSIYYSTKPQTSDKQLKKDYVSV